MPESQRSAALEPDRRPKALRYAEKVNAAEQMIVDALPEIIGKLVSMARDGDVAAARYLVDRIYGRTAVVPAPAASDTRLPYTPLDWADAEVEKSERRKAIQEVRERWSQARFDAIFGAAASRPSDRTPRSIPGVGVPHDRKRKLT